MPPAMRRSIILTDASSVSLYADADDTVATNPAGTVGVRITDSEKKTCYDAVTTRLAEPS